MEPLSAYRARPVYVIDGARTPFLKSRGVPGPFPAAELAVQAGRGLLNRLDLEPEHIEQLVLGCVMPGPDEANIARVIALRLGLPEATPAHTVQRNCASGMQALDDAASLIAAGRAELVLAGGSEAMSHAPLLWARAMVEWLARWRAARTLPARGQALAALRPAMFTPVIGLLRGLTDPVVGLSMGQTAELLAQRFAIPREAADAYALQSHQRALAAREGGRFSAEIVPLFDQQGRVRADDDGVRADSDAATLARLKPAFDRADGLVTAGNSAQISDGAALLLLASEAAVRRHDLPVLGQIVDVHWAGLAPQHMGLGPVYASTPLLTRHGLDMTDLAGWEINEAFASQILACLAAWGDPGYARAHLGLADPLPAPDPARLNPDGGAIAQGHPVGASGARLVLHLLHSLKAHGPGARGIATLCIGGGQGGAMLLEAA